MNAEVPKPVVKTKVKVSPVSDDHSSTSSAQLT